MSIIVTVKFGTMIAKRYLDLSTIKQSEYSLWRSCRRFLIGLWAILSCAIYTHPAQAQPFTVLCGIPETHESYRPVKFALTQALASIGYRLDLKFASAARAFHFLTHNKADAICLTTHFSLGLFDTGIGRQLNTVLGSSDLNAWSTNPKIKLDHPLINQNSQLKIGYLKDHSPDFLLQHQGLTNTVATKDVSMAAKMMINQRLDVIILIETETYEKTLSYWLERQKTGSSKGLRYNRIDEISYAPYLHKRHQELARPLEQALEKIIKAQGGPISKKTILKWTEASKAYQ